MQELLKKAEDLGRQLAAHPRFKALIAARDAVRDNQEAARLLRDYSSHADRIQELAAHNRPIEVADKQKLSSLEQAVASNAVLKRLMQAQADFTEMMNRINRAIFEKIAPADDE